MAPLIDPLDFLKGCRKSSTVLFPVVLGVVAEFRVSEDSTPAEKDLKVLEVDEADSGAQESIGVGDP